MESCFRKHKKVGNLFFITCILVIVSCDTGTNSVIPENPEVETTNIYVNQQFGDDGNFGTPDEPFQSIQAAIDYATANYEKTDIFISEGTYSSNYRVSGQPVVKMEEGISIYGGYSNSNWTNRDIDLYKTILIDSSTTGGELDSPNRTIDFKDISANSIIDGFYVYCGTGEINLGIFLVRSSPIIQNNRVHTYDGGLSVCIYNLDNSSPIIRDNIITGDNPSGCFAIYNLEYCSPHIYRNIISGSTSNSTNTDQSIGIYNDVESDSYIYNNLIDGGNGDYSLGIYNDASSPIIRNNTINGGHNTQSYTIALAAGNADITLPLSSPYIENNIIFNSDGLACYGYYDFDRGAPASNRYNNFYNCSDSYSSNNNVSFEPAFIDEDGDDDNLLTIADNNWHLSDSSNILLQEGGINGNHSSELWIFNTDMDLNTRTTQTSSDITGWSIGAYEYISSGVTLNINNRSYVNESSTRLNQIINSDREILTPSVLKVSK